MKEPSTSPDEFPCPPCPTQIDGLHRLEAMALALFGLAVEAKRTGRRLDPAVLGNTANDMLADLDRLLWRINQHQPEAV